MRRGPDEQALLKLLGVDEHATWEEVRRAFRDAVRASHPDLNDGDPDAERRVKTLNIAWEAVNTPGKWSIYTTGGEPPARPGGTASTSTRLRVQRLQQGSFGLINWNVELDGEVIGTVANGGVTVIDAQPGAHRLRVFYGSRSSAPLQIHLRRGHELSVGCRARDDLRVSLFSPKRSLLVELLGTRPV